MSTSSATTAQLFELYNTNPEFVRHVNSANTMQLINEMIHARMMGEEHPQDPRRLSVERYLKAHWRDKESLVQMPVTHGKLRTPRESDEDGELRGGSYCMPTDEDSKSFVLALQCLDFQMNKRKYNCFTENPGENGKLLIDLDFKFKGKFTERPHSLMQPVLNAVSEVLRDNFEMDPYMDVDFGRLQSQDTRMFWSDELPIMPVVGMEKSSMEYDEESDWSKDGLHIVVSVKMLQVHRFMFYRLLLKKLESDVSLAEYPCCDGFATWDKILDHPVTINTSRPWILYMNSKYDETKDCLKRPYLAKKYNVLFASQDEDESEITRFATPSLNFGECGIGEIDVRPRVPGTDHPLLTVGEWVMVSCSSIGARGVRVKNDVGNHFLSDPAEKELMKKMLGAAKKERGDVALLVPRVVENVIETINGSLVLELVRGLKAFATECNNDREQCKSALVDALKNFIAEAEGDDAETLKRKKQYKRDLGVTSIIGTYYPEYHEPGKSHVNSISFALSLKPKGDAVYFLIWMCLRCFASDFKLTNIVDRFETWSFLVSNGSSNFGKYVNMAKEYPQTYEKFVGPLNVADECTPPSNVCMLPAPKPLETVVAKRSKKRSFVQTFSDDEPENVDVHVDVDVDMDVDVEEEVEKPKKKKTKKAEEKMPEEEEAEEEEEKDKSNNYPSYAMQKREFEERHCLIVNASVYVKVTNTNAICMLPQTKLIQSYQHLKCYSVEVRDKKRVRVENCFIRQWIVDKDIRCYEDMNIFPEGGDPCPPDVLNLWRPFEMQLVTEWTHKESELLFFLEHVRILCGRNEAVYKWVVAWMAHMVRYPGQKPGKVPVFISKQGTGKSFLEDFFGKLLGKSKVMSTSDFEGDIACTHNTLFANSYLCFLDEIKSEQMKRENGKYKKAVTSLDLNVNPKGVSHYQMSSFHRIIVTVNDECPVQTSKDDRRNCIIRSSDELVTNLRDPEKQRANHQYFSRLYALNKDVNSLKTIFEYLYNYEGAHGFMNLDKPVTEFMELAIDMAEESHVLKRFLKQFCVTVRDDKADEFKFNADGKLVIGASDLYDEFRRFCEAATLRTWSTNNFSKCLLLTFVHCVVRKRANKGNVYIVDMGKLSADLDAVGEEEDDADTKIVSKPCYLQTPPENHLELIVPLEELSVDALKELYKARDPRVTKADIQARMLAELDAL